LLEFPPQSPHDDFGVRFAANGAGDLAAELLGCFNLVVGDTPFRGDVVNRGLLPTWSGPFCSGVTFWPYPAILDDVSLQSQDVPFPAIQAGLVDQCPDFLGGRHVAPKLLHR
jgi:hypothetical protein